MHLRRFNNVDSAERCIDGLRKYRNLHPSFSKVGESSTLGSLFNVHRSKCIGSLARNTLNTMLSSRPIKMRVHSSRVWRNSRILPRLISTSKGESFSFRPSIITKIKTRLPLSIDEEVLFHGTTETDKSL